AGPRCGTASKTRGPRSASSCGAATTTPANRSPAASSPTWPALDRRSISRRNLPRASRSRSNSKPEGVEGSGGDQDTDEVPVPSKLFLVRELGQARCDPPQHLDGLVDPVVGARDQTAKKFVVLGLLGYAVDHGFCLAELGARFTNELLDLRSEERRVGKGCSFVGSSWYYRGLVQTRA